MQKRFRPTRYILFLAVAVLAAVVAISVAAVPGTPVSAATHSARISHNGNPPGTPTAQPTATTVVQTGATATTRFRSANGNPPGATLPATGGANPAGGAASGPWLGVSLALLLVSIGLLLTRSRKR